MQIILLKQSGNFLFSATFLHGQAKPVIYFFACWMPASAASPHHAPWVFAHAGAPARCPGGLSPHTKVLRGLLGLGGRQSRGGRAVPLASPLCTVLLPNIISCEPGSPGLPGIAQLRAGSSYWSQTLCRLPPAPTKPLSLHRALAAVT